MTTFSKSDLATRILRDAGLIGAEEVPSAIDLLWAEETLSSEIDLMAEKGILIWNGSEIDVPNAYLTTLSRRIGIAIGPSFGQMAIADASVAIPVVERDLRILSTVPSTGAVQEGDYF
jgi:hypothetical protein